MNTTTQTEAIQYQANQEDVIVLQAGVYNPANENHVLLLENIRLTGEPYCEKGTWKVYGMFFKRPGFVLQDINGVEIADPTNILFAGTKSAIDALVEENKNGYIAKVWANQTKINGTVQVISEEEAFRDMRLMRQTKPLFYWYMSAAERKAQLAGSPTETEYRNNAYRNQNVAHFTKQSAAAAGANVMKLFGIH